MTTRDTASLDSQKGLRLIKQVKLSNGLGYLSKQEFGDKDKYVLSVPNENYRSFIWVKKSSEQKTRAITTVENILTNNYDIRL